MRRFYFLFLVLVCSVAVADQAAYVSQEVADAAARLLSKGTEVKLFCPPCGDPAPRVETVQTAKVKYTGSESFYELYINDTAQDLAYLYLNVEGEWVNLALHLGVEVQEVPSTLSEDQQVDDVFHEEEMANPTDITRLHFLGKVGEKHVLMEVGKFQDDLYGSYRYLHVGEIISLEGTFAQEGETTLTETVEEKKTGQFVGKFSEGAKTFTGKWLSPDGQRSLDFSLQRVAMVVEEVSTVNTPGASTSSVLERPYFAAVPGSEALNAYLEEFQQKPFREQVKAVVQTAWDDLKLKVEAEDPMLLQSMNISGYQFCFYDGAFLSLSFLEDSYGGGAHGNSSTGTINLTISKEGKLKALTLKDLFSDADAALKLISPALIEDLKKQEAASIVDGQTKEFGWDDLGAWTVDAKGITFYFDPYAVGPYAQGAFLSELPWKTVAGVLNQQTLPAEMIAAASR